MTSNQWVALIYSLLTTGIGIYYTRLMIRIAGFRNVYRELLVGWAITFLIAFAGSMLLLRI